MDKQLLIIALFWLIYGVLHSWLATTTTKQYVQQHFSLNEKNYRLIYVIIASVFLLPIVHIVWSDGSEYLWQHSGRQKWFFDGLAICSLIGFVIVARSYNMASFLGLKADEDKQSFRISFTHRFVRHPWYFFGLIIIWTRDMSILWLANCVCITLYLIIGSRLEDRKLLIQYGDTYRAYFEKVPGLMIVPGRYLNKADVHELESVK